MRMGRAICPFFIMQKVKILKPFQNASVWFAVGQVVEVTELRAKDLIVAGLAQNDIPVVATKPSLATQTKPGKATTTKKSGQAVDPATPKDDKTNGQQGDPGTDQSEPNPVTPNDGITGDQQDPINTTGSDNTNNDQG